MRYFALTLYAIALLGAVFAQQEQCSKEYACQFTIVDPDDGNAAFTFDFSSLCSATDYVAQDSDGHTYYANVCTEASNLCLPADCDNYPYCVPWQNTYMYGNAVQMWGQVPPYPPADPSLNCYPYNQPTTAVPCTKSCQVLGVGAPSWSLSNPIDPYNSDIIGTWSGVPPTPQDPFYCPPDPLTGNPQSRQVHFVFQCAPGVAQAQMYKAVQNVTEACHYTLYFKTQQACINKGMSGGDIFLILLFSCAALYFGGGALYNYLRFGKLAVPHAAFWVSLPRLVVDGLVFLKDVVTGQRAKSTFRPVPGSDAGATAYDASSVSYQTYDDGQELHGDKGAAAAYADL